LALGRVHLNWGVFAVGTGFGLLFLSAAAPVSLEFAVAQNLRALVLHALVLVFALRELLVASNVSADRPRLYLSLFPLLRVRIRFIYLSLIVILIVVVVLIRYGLSVGLNFISEFPKLAFVDFFPEIFKQ